MKQKKINDILYVFDITPYQITEDTDAEVIKVQQEVVSEFKELNESLADKIVPYNYHVMTVTEQEWAPYVDGDDPEPEPEPEPDPEPEKLSPELAWSAESATVTIGAENTFPTLSNPHSLTILYGANNDEVATINDSTGEITLVGAGEVQIFANFLGDETYEAQTIAYVLTVEAASQEFYNLVVTYTGFGAGNPKPEVEAYWDGEHKGWIQPTSTVDNVYTYSIKAGGKFEFDERALFYDGTITFDPTLQTADPADLWGVGTPYTMPSENVACAVYAGTGYSTATLQTPYGLAIYDESASDFLTDTAVDTDASIYEIAKGVTYSVEQRSGLGENMVVSINPNILTGYQGTVGAAFMPNGYDNSYTLTLDAPN